MATTYPAQIDNPTTLHDASNRAFSALASPLSNTETGQLELQDASRFPSTGGWLTIRKDLGINEEHLSYTAKSGNFLTGLSRGLNGTSAGTYEAGKNVYLDYAAEFHNHLRGAIIAIETELGLLPKGNYPNVGAQLTNHDLRHYARRDASKFNSGSMDEVAVRAAIDDLLNTNPNGGVIVMPSGDWHFNDQLLITEDNVHLIGQGRATAIDVATLMPGGKSLILFSGCNRSSIREVGINLDTNAQYYGVQILNSAHCEALRLHLSLDAGLPAYHPGGILVQGCTHTAIRVCSYVVTKVSTGAIRGFYLVTSPYSGVIGGNATGCTSGVFLQATTYGFVDAVTVRQPVAGQGGSIAGIALQSNAHYNQIVNNIVDMSAEGVSGGALRLSDSGGDCNYNILENNTLIGKPATGTAVYLNANKNKVGSNIIKDFYYGYQLIEDENLVGPDLFDNVNVKYLSVFTTPGTAHTKHKRDHNGEDVDNVGQMEVTSIKGVLSEIANLTPYDRAKYGLGTNQMQLSGQAGEHNILLGSARYVWEDLRAPATAINPPGLVSDPDWDGTNLGWLFDATSTEMLQIILQTKHKYAEGTVVVPHIHWEPTNTNTGDVYWRLEYVWYNNNETMPGWSTINIQVPASGTANRLQLDSFGNVTGTGKLISSFLKVKLYRIGGDALDTYNAGARLVEFDVHIREDSMGSRQELLK